MVVLHPWFVTWRSPKTRKRYRKQFQALPHAIEFIATKAQYADPHASVVSRHPYDVIPALRGKFPAKRGGYIYYWCPMCVTARQFFPLSEDVTFWTAKKTWYETKGRYEWPDRRVRVLQCRICGCTNRNHYFRRSNQPWEKRRFKRGVRRTTKRRKR
jgi:hypothetical protein